MTAREQSIGDKCILVHGHGNMQNAEFQLRTGRF